MTLNTLYKAFLIAVFGLGISALSNLVSLKVEPQYQTEYREFYESMTVDGSLTPSEMEELSSRASEYQYQSRNDPEYKSRAITELKLLSAIVIFSIIFSFIIGWKISKYKTEEVLLFIGVLGTSTIYSNYVSLTISVGLSVIAGALIFKLRQKDIDP